MMIEKNTYERFVDGSYYHEGIVWDNGVIWGME